MCAAQAQQEPTEGRDPNAPSAPQPAASAAPADQQKTAEPAQPASTPAPFEHSFWDRENDWLFAGVAAGRALDYASTLNLRRRGINEVFLTNSIVDNHPLFAWGSRCRPRRLPSASPTCSIAPGHHRLERWTSAIHAGVGSGGRVTQLRAENAASLMRRGISLRARFVLKEFRYLWGKRLPAQTASGLYRNCDQQRGADLWRPVYYVEKFQGRNRHFPVLNAGATKSPHASRSACAFGPGCIILRALRLHSPSRRRSLVGRRKVSRRSNRAAAFFSALFFLFVAGLSAFHPRRAARSEAPHSACKRGHRLLRRNSPSAGQVAELHAYARPAEARKPSPTRTRGTNCYFLSTSPTGSSCSCSCCSFASLPPTATGRQNGPTPASGRSLFLRRCCC